MPISFRTYATMAVVFGGLIFLLATFFGNDIAQWAVARQVEAASKGQPIIEQVVFGPLEFMMAQDTRLFGAIMAGLFWPFLLILMFLVVISIVLLSFIDVNAEISNELGMVPSFFINVI